MQVIFNSPAKYYTSGAAGKAKFYACPDYLQPSPLTQQRTSLSKGHARALTTCSATVETAQLVASPTASSFKPVPFNSLQRCLPELVKNLQHAPLLFLAHNLYHSEVIRLPCGSSADETLWGNYSRMLASKAPNMYIFAEEVLCGGDSCVLRSQQEPHVMQSLEPIPSTPQCAQEIADTNTPTVSGKLGDCCEEEESLGASTSKRDAHAVMPLGNCNHSSEQGSTQVRFWGLVVRTHNHSDPVEGCYLLKTTRNVDSTGCTCVHYSMIKVRADESLQQQLLQSWLV